MFGWIKRRNAAGLPAYDQRHFVSSDARDFAFDDYHAVMLSQSGLAGATPVQNIIAAEAPSGFDYTTNLIGLGGSPAPVKKPQPLIYSPQIAASFLANMSGNGGS